MKRFSQVLSALPTPLQPNYLQVGLDLGSSITRIRVDNALRLQQPSCAIVHSQTETLVALGSKAVQLHPRAEQQVLFKAPIRKAVPTDISLVSSFIKVLLDQSIKKSEMKLLTQVSGVCLIPSTATKVEKYLFKKLFEKLGVGRWQLVPKAQVWSAILKQKKYQNCLGCIDLGGDTTEITLVADQTTLAETIPFGGRKLVKRLLQRIRAEYGFQLSWESGEKVLKEIDLAQLQSKKSKTKITIRGKNISSGRPETVVIEEEVLNPIIQDFYAELLSFIQLFLYSVPAAALTETLDAGIVLSGGLSQVSGSKHFFESALDTSVVISKTPQEDLIRNVW
jgi:rod shape-determining protein MreB